jgi:5-methyltetrahydropteroyltriglutamate--homocysteine methyltransferase
MARGAGDARPLDMTKWLDTNYHHLVPEVGAETPLAPHPEKALAEFEQALEWGVRTRPVLIGPVSLLLLSRVDDASRPLALLDRLIPVYTEILARLAAAGATAVQIDEPCLVFDRTKSEIEAVEWTWHELADAAPEVDLTLATYFGGLGPWLERVLSLPAREFHLDLVSAPEQLPRALEALDGHARLSAGVIDGRNVWAADLDAVLRTVDPALEQLGADRVRIAPSCSLLHVPYAASRERHLDPELRSSLAFGREKLLELAALKEAVNAGGEDSARILRATRAALASWRASPQVHDPSVNRRLESLSDADYQRASPYAERAGRQAERLGLPELPTTTIGSFPQTDEIRRARRELAEGGLTPNEYEYLIEDEIRRAVECQEHLGLDVLVHGEPERSDMVQYFAEQLRGFATTEHGWVQSYGSRCVKPPILFGDVSRPGPMTLRWWRFAQGLARRPVKGMLTGPVTMLQWSFVRNDQPRERTCRQLALAIRDEAVDLEHAGALVIQIDEAALREGLPLRRVDQTSYLRWAVDCFRLSAGGLGDHVQMHSHMCYSDFNAILRDIARMDADVISIEASRSRMELLDAFEEYAYPQQVGPGVYDVHSPRVPTVEEIEKLLEDAERRLPRERLWVNPDCGLKTRTWEHVVPALEHLVSAARRRRASGGASLDRRGG